MVRYSQRIQQSSESVLVLIGSARDGVSDDIGADHGGIDQAGSIAVAIVKCHNQKSISTRLKIRLTQKRGERRIQECVGIRSRGIMAVMQAVRSNERELGQGIVGQVRGKMRKVNDLGLRSGNVAQNIAIPGCAVVATIIVSAIRQDGATWYSDILSNVAGSQSKIVIPGCAVVATIIVSAIRQVWSCYLSACRRIRLRVYLPRDSPVIHLPENIVVSDGRGAIISGAAEVMRAAWQDAIYAVVAAPRFQPQVIHQ